MDNSICSRLREIRKANGYTQKQFADALGLKQSTIATYESGRQTPSDRTISDICNKFNVDLVWLRTGVGEMYKPKTREEALAEIFARAQIDDDDRSRLLRTIAQLPDEYLPIFVKGLEKICKILSEDK